MIPAKIKRDYTLLLLGVIALECIFFKSIIQNSDLLLGDLGDNRLLNSIMEHWYRVFTFKTHEILTMPMFYPIKGSIGYTDTSFLPAIPYTFFRILGQDWLGAGQAAYIFIHAFGSLTIAILLYRYFKLPVYTVIIGIIIANCGNNYYLVAARYAQLLHLSLIPLLLLFVFQFYDNIHNKKKRMIYGCASLVYLALLTFSSYYMGFFAAFFLMITHIVFICRILAEKRMTFKKIIDLVYQKRKEFLIYLGAAILGLLPFIVAFGPVYINAGDYTNTSDVVLNLAPRMFDYFNIMPTNMVWEFPLARDESPPRYNWWFGQENGFPPVTLFLGLIALYYFLGQRKKEKSKNDYIYFAAAAAVAVIVVLSLRFQGGKSLWYFVFKLFPPARGVRALFRILLFLGLPLGILISVFLAEKVKASEHKNIAYCVVAFLTLFVLAENQNNAGVYNWNKSLLRNYFARMSPPPSDCTSFVLIDRNRNPNGDYMSRVTAVNIATIFNVPTLDGFGTVRPYYHGWKEPSLVGFDDYIQDWIVKHKLENVYAFDSAFNTWYPYTKENIEEATRLFERPAQ